MQSLKTPTTKSCSLKLQRRQAYKVTRRRSLKCLSVSPVAETTGTEVAEHDEVIRRRLPLLSRVSACIEVDDLVASYETFAGRSAMVGFLIAVLVEGITQQGIFYSFTRQDFSIASYVALLSMLLGAWLAYVTRRPFGSKFIEAVISSLTAARRSASSVSQMRVDKAVDQLFDKAFNFAVLYDILDEELL